MPVDGRNKDMAAKSMSRMVLLAVAACGLALLLVGVYEYRGNSAVDPHAVSKALPVATPALFARDQAPADLAWTQVAGAQAKSEAWAVAVAGSILRPERGEDLPAFDIARIEPTGDGVIAGRTAPGAMVELLRDGQLHDKTTADQSGQFVMVPPRLPSGTYDLTLRSRQPDGKQATSEQRVAVSIEPSATDLPVTALMKPGKPALVLSQPDASTGAVVAIAPQFSAAGTTILANGGLPSTVVVAKIATTTVSPGDSLWRLGRLNYGAGTRYAVIYKANREQIRNPNLIHPGQIFLLPAR
jgi:nucleoid-associated protein YgaU